MSQSVREFLRSRRTEISSELGPLEESFVTMEKRIVALRLELADLDKAESALGPSPDAIGPPEEEAEKPAKGILKEGTIKDFVVRILSDRPSGLVALDILSAINKRFGTSYPRTSLSPQLSRLKQEGVLERHGMVWTLAKEKGPAEESAEPYESDGGGSVRERGYPPSAPGGSNPPTSTAGLLGWDFVSDEASTPLHKG